MVIRNALGVLGFVGLAMTCACSSADGSADAAHDQGGVVPETQRTHRDAGAGSEAGAGSNGGGSGVEGGSGSTGGNGADSGTGSTGSGSSSDASTGGGSDPSTRGPADLFPADSPWYRDVSSLPVDATSSSILDAVGSWGTGRFLIDFSIVFLHANASTQQQSFAIDWPDESDVQPVPVPAQGSLEGEDGYACTQGGDCHLIVVDASKNLLFELWSATNSPSWQASQETVWDLTKHYGADGRGYGCTSADAAGLSVMAGLIGLRETMAGDIRHALRFILPNSKIRKGPSFVAPATHGTSATSSTAGPPFGTRLRLKSTYDESKIASAGGKAVVRALKKYGMILADGGNYALTAEDEKFEKQQDPSLTWDGLLGGSDLQSITPKDFDVVDYGTVRTTKDCTRAN